MLNFAIIKWEKILYLLIKSVPNFLKPFAPILLNNLPQISKMIKAIA